MLAELPPELNPLGAEQEPELVEPDIIVKPEPVDDALPGTSSPFPLSRPSSDLETI